MATYHTELSIEKLKDTVPKQMVDYTLDKVCQSLDDPSWQEDCSLGVDSVNILSWDEVPKDMLKDLSSCIDSDLAIVVREIVEGYNEVSLVYYNQGQGVSPAIQRPRDVFNFN